MKAHVRSSMCIIWSEKLHRKECLSIFMLICTELTFDLILGPRDNFRLDINPYRFYYTYRDIINIYLGDMNADLVNPNVHSLKDILILNSLNNAISQPTKQHTLLDPIIIHNDMSFRHQCILEIPPGISDHSTTYLYLPFQYPPHRSFTRKVRLY